MSQRGDDVLKSSTAMRDAKVFHVAVDSNSHSSQINQSCFEDLLG